MVKIFLYHYYDKTVGPFVSLSDLPVSEAKAILNNIKLNKPKTQSAARDSEYVEHRHNCENIIRAEFERKGGVIKRMSPHYMVIQC